MDELMENKLGVSQVGNEFIATRHIVESYTPERLVKMVEAFDQRISNKAVEIEASMKELEMWQKSRKDWESAYQRAKNMLPATKGDLDGGSKKDSGDTK